MLSYYLILPILYFFAYLPTGVLYKIADVLAFVLCNVIGYRKQVTLTNLRNSFPEKSEEEIKQIARESYTHLADRIVENIKCFTITPQEIDHRVNITNPELFDHYFNKGQHVVIVVGHVASWEFGTFKLGTTAKHKLYGIVSLVKNPYFNALIQRTRGKMGMTLIVMQKSKEFFQMEQPAPSLTAFISDQSPSNMKTAYWTNFLHQDSAFFTGGERYAKLHNCAVIFPNFHQTKRGYYDSTLQLITDTPNDTAEFEITEKFVRLLEQQIQAHPADWLWSHKRWKRKRENQMQ